MKKKLQRALFWEEMKTRALARKNYYEKDLDSELDRPRTERFLFYSKSWHEHRIMKADVLYKFCNERFKIAHNEICNA